MLVLQIPFNSIIISLYVPLAMYVPLIVVMTLCHPSSFQDI
nr:MAG TPA: hypothetical protein [Caudoviricetes sp.]